MLERTPQPAFDPDAVTAALGEDASDALREFTRILFARGAAEDLARYRPQDLGALAVAAFAHWAERTASQAKIRVWNPAGELGRVTIVEIANDNMPFLVDSTLGELTERALDIRLVLHPIVTVARDAAGRLTGFKVEALPEPG